VCSSVTSVKYLFKYVYKGHDRVKFGFTENNEESKDEITNYLDARFVSASEAAWRILKFPMSGQFPATTRLSIHLENQQSVVFKENQLAEDAIKNKDKTQLTEYFEYNIHPSNQELYCLRQILMRKAGATSYADLRTHNHVQYETFTEAEIAMGLLDSDEEWELTLTEAFSFMTRGIDMRKLFCVILSQCRPSNPGSLWNKFKDDLSRDILYEYKTKNNLPDLTFNDMIYQQALKMIDDI